MMDLASHDGVELAEDIGRLVAIVLLSVAGGLMARYYLTRPKMPVHAFVGFFCYVVALLGTEVYKIQTGGVFRWWLTPFSILGSLSVIKGVWPSLRLSHTSRNH